MSSAPDSSAPSNPNAEVAARLEGLSREFEDIKKSLAQLKQIAGPDPAMALVRARKILEYVVSDLFRRHVKEPLGTRPLDNLIDRLTKDGVIDLHLKAYMDQVRGLGNAAAHGDVNHEFSEADVMRAMDALLVVLEWYFKKENIGDASHLQRQITADDAAVLQYCSDVRHAEQVRATVNFWRLCGGLVGIVSLAILLWAVHAWTGVGPPWPPPLQTFIFSLAAMSLGWFASDRGAQLDLVPRRAPRWLVWSVSIALLLFVLLMAVFTIPAPSWPNLESRGLWLQEPIAKHLDNTPGSTLEDEFAGESYNPFAIWVPWTVRLVRGILLLMWLVLLAGLAALVDCLWWWIQEKHYDRALPA